MGTYERALEMCAKVNAQYPDLLITPDPRSATPPCALITPPRVTLDGYCTGTAAWQVFALAPATGNADAWRVLDSIAAQLAEVLNIESWLWVGYALSNDQPILPAYLLTFTEGVDVS